MRDWLGGLLFTASLTFRNAVYAVFILIIRLSQSERTIAGLSLKTSSHRDLGRLPIRGRADGIDVVGIDDGNGSQESMAAKRKVYDQGDG